jgi:TonB family protein
MDFGSEFEAEPQGPDLESDPDLADFVAELAGIEIPQRADFEEELLAQLEQSWVMEEDPELQDLLTELSALDISERPSFRPELLAQLERTWLKEAVIPGRRWAWSRMAAAAAVAGLIMSVSVPPARAAIRAFFVGSAEADAPVEVMVPSTRFVAAPVPEVVSTLDVADQPAPTPDYTEPSLPMEAVEPFIPARVTYPELRDRESSEALILSFYPADLRSFGIGGTARVALWIDPEGSVSEPRVVESSGVAGLDQAAVAAAPNLRFYPALERGIPRGTWVEFDMVFRAPGAAERVDDEPVVMDEPVIDDLREPDLVNLEDAPLGPTMGTFALDGEDLLLQALGPQAEGETELGSAQSLLAGEAPASVLPLAWRAEAAATLEAAILRSPGNPAPYLALGRIRVNQGLDRDALRLFNLGLSRVESTDRAIPPEVVAGLHYERGLILHERWAPWADLGRVASSEVHREDCSQAGPVEATDGYVDTASLIRWNYLCPAKLETVFSEAFEPQSGPGRVYHEAVLDGFRSAADAHPAHREAATELILHLAEDGEWDEARERARTFAVATGGSVEAILLRGLVEHRSGNSARAQELFSLALANMPATERETLTGVSSVVTPQELHKLAAAGDGERSEMMDRFWALADPTPGTELNEAWVEHVSRGVYATRRFGSNRDAIEAWLRYGRPDAVRAFGQGETRIEFWDLGPGPDLTFHRPAGSFGLTLTAEGRAYLEELKAVEARRWPLPGSVKTLSGQATRFPGAESGFARVHLGIDVSALELDPGEGIPVTVLALDAEGDAEVLERFTRYDMGSVLRTAAEAGTEVSELVVDLELPDGTRAVYRTPVAATSSDPASGLMLVRPATAGTEFEGRWNAESVQTLASADLVAGGTVGLYAEFRPQTAAAGAPVPVFQAALRSADGARVIPLRVRAAGAGDPRTTWPGEPDLDGVYRVYAVADLDGISAGDYTVVLGTVGTPDSALGVASREVRIR